MLYPDSLKLLTNDSKLLSNLIGTFILISTLLQILKFNGFKVIGWNISYVTYVDDKSFDLISTLNIIKESSLDILFLSFNRFSHSPKSIFDKSILSEFFWSSNVDNCNKTFSVLMIVFSFV